jgi:thiol-disulfide isomerase/thioredoxin
MAALFVAPLLLALTAGAPSADERADSPRAELAASADALRRLSAVDLTGTRWTADSLRGRVVLVDFWATWCAPCLAELPRLQALRRRYGPERFEILGISLDVRSRRDFVAWLNRQRVDWPQIHDRGGYAGPIARLFAIDRLPRTLLVGPDGAIAALDLRGEPLSRAVDALVRGTAAAMKREGR